MRKSRKERTLFKPGDIVISKAGHDEGRMYMVITADEEFCLVCDGQYRKLTLLKKKRNKHLRFIFGGGLPDRPTDANIKRIIKEYKKTSGQG